jgi:phage FluMu protein Com
MQINGKIFRELRCRVCRKLICYEYVYAGRIAYHCPRCGEYTAHTFKHLQTKNVKDTMDQYQVSAKKGGE